MIERVILLRCADRAPGAVGEVADRILALLRSLPEVAGAAAAFVRTSASTSASSGAPGSRAS